MFAEVVKADPTTLAVDAIVNAANERPSPARTLILDGFLGLPWRWERLRRLIEQRVGPAEIFRYDSTGRCTIPSLGERLIDEIRRPIGVTNRDAAGDGVNLIGFSMGGMVIRAAHAIEPALPIRRAVFMNSPHRGTWLAHLIPTPGVRQMRPGDAFLDRIDAAPWAVPTLTVWNGFDGIILPPRNTRWHRGGEHVRCRVPIHIWPVWSRGIHRRVVDFLAV